VEAYRIVNEWDVIARFPRSHNASFLDYDHAGRTVLLAQPEPGKDIWVSGWPSGLSALSCVHMYGDTVFIIFHSLSSNRASSASN
jgi:hypothetical protein